MTDNVIMYLLGLATPFIGILFMRVFEWYWTKERKKKAKEFA